MKLRFGPVAPDPAEISCLSRCSAEGHRNGNGFLCGFTRQFGVLAILGPTIAARCQRLSPPKLELNGSPRRTRRREAAKPRSREAAKPRGTNRCSSRLGISAVQRFTFLLFVLLLPCLRHFACRSLLRLLRPAVVAGVPAEGLASRIAHREQADDAGVRSARARGSRGSAPCASGVPVGREPVKKGTPSGCPCRREVISC